MLTSLQMKCLPRTVQNTFGSLYYPIAKTSLQREDRMRTDMKYLNVSWRLERALEGT